MTALHVRSTHAPNAERHGVLAGQWLASLTSENTTKAYRRDLAGYFSFLDAHDLDALDARREHVDLFRHSLTGASSTVARKLSAVSSFYSYAGSAGRVTANPAALVKRPKVASDAGSTPGMTDQQAQALLDAARADSARSYALVSVLLFTGARLSEALGANFSDLRHDAGHRLLTVTRKGGTRAPLPLPPQVVNALGSYLGASVAQGSEITITDAASAHAPIFRTATGKRWASSEAFRTIQRLARLSGIEGEISPHSLRVTHITMALAHGAPIHEVQDSVGHKDPRTTQRYNRGRNRLERSSAYTVASVLS